MELAAMFDPDAFNRISLAARYHRARIPGIVSLANGTLLLYYECRAGGDWSAIDIGCQKSRDGGRSWSETEILVSGKGRNAMNNPVMIADGETVHFLYCENYKRLFCRRSDTGGETWSAPRELTGAIEAETEDLPWTVLAVGPGHGIRTRAGRLLAPMWFALNPADLFAHHPSLVRCLFSDDGGGSWRLGESIGADMAEDYSECCVAELPDGSLILNIRNEAPRKQRKTARSADGGQSWSAPVFAPELPDPTCCAGLCRCGNALLFSNCANALNRRDLTVKRIENGRIAEALTISKEGGYSDICFSETFNRAFVAFEDDGPVIRVAGIIP